MWRNLALKAIVAKDKVLLDAIMKHCYEPASKDVKSRFSESSVVDLFAVKEERLVEL